MNPEQTHPKFLRKYGAAIIFATIFAAYGLAIASSKTYSLEELFFVLLPPGFLNLVLVYGQSGLLFLVFMTLTGFVLGKVATLLWNWRWWSIIIIPITLFLNAYGFSIWLFSQMD